MTDQSTATHIFISHSSAESAFVRLADDLQQVSIPIWVDHQKLKPGTRNWEKAIRAGLKQARALIYVGSAKAREAEYVLNCSNRPGDNMTRFNNRLCAYKNNSLLFV